MAQKGLQSWTLYELERELTALETTSPLPEAPEEARVEEWVLDAYRRSWQLSAATLAGP